MISVQNKLILVTIMLCVTLSGCGDDSPTAPTAVLAAESHPTGVAGSGSSFAAVSPAVSGLPGSDQTPIGAKSVNSSPPGRVENLIGLQVSGRNAVQLTWNPPRSGTVLDYVVTRGSYNESTLPAGDCVGIPVICTALFEWLSLDPHSFTVKARNSAGYGEPSWVEVIVGEITGPVAVPNAVINLVATQSPGTLTVGVTWTPPTTGTVPTSYTVAGPLNLSRTLQHHRCTGTGVNGFCSVSFDNVPVGSGTFSVASVAGSGTGPASLVTVDVTEAIPPAFVQYFTGVQVGYDNAVVLSWHPPVDGRATYYTAARSGVYVDATIQHSECLVEMVEVLVTICSVTLDSLTYDEHWFTVTPHNGAGAGPRSEVSVSVVDVVTAAFSRIPASHNGDTFVFWVTFSEDMPLRRVSLLDHAFTVSGGEVTRVRRAPRRQNLTWKVWVTPSGDSTVRVTLPGNRSCSAAGAVCAEDGRQLSADVRLTVPR